MNQLRQTSPTFIRDGIALSFLATALTVFYLWIFVINQRFDQKTADVGVITIHIDQSGQLRLWNQPIDFQDLSLILEKLRTHREKSAPKVIRLIPASQVPWGVVNSLLYRLRPPDLPQQTWILQLQLP